MKVAATASSEISSKKDVCLFPNSNFSRMLDQTSSFLNINAMKSEKKKKSHLDAVQIFYFILHLRANLLHFKFLKVTKRNRDIFEHRHFFSSVRFVLCLVREALDITVCGKDENKKHHIFFCSKSERNSFIWILILFMHLLVNNNFSWIFRSVVFFWLW